MPKYILWGMLLVVTVSGALFAQRTVGVATGGDNLAVMEADTIRLRTNAQGLKPFVMTNLKPNTGLAEMMAFIEKRGKLAAG